MIEKFSQALSLTNPRRLSIRRRYCPVCDTARTFLKLDDDEIAVRCLACRASVVTLSIVDVIRRECPDLDNLSVYELSSRGPLFRYLAGACGKLTASEYFPAGTSGRHYRGVLCQDVQHLSFEPGCFDLCTSTDVFEHVRDDRAGFRNIRRVLKAAGKFIFTVPLYGQHTVERVRLRHDGAMDYLLPPEFHGDSQSPDGKILALRNYGSDIVDRLLEAGFASAAIVPPALPDYWGFSRRVVVARK